MDELNRFIVAQESDYENALQEIKNGQKRTHWMWYIFPQIVGLGMSEISVYFSIKSLEEAESYLDNEILGNRLLEISKELLKLDTNDPEEVFGYIDALKLNSSMTLFSYVSNEEVFNKVIDKYFNGNKDNKTIEICEQMKNNHHRVYSVKNC